MAKLYSHNFLNGVGPWTGSGWSLDGDALRMNYQAFNSPNRDDNGGTGYADISHPVEEFTLRWEERFSSNWVWSPVATKGWQLEPRSGSQNWKIYLMNDKWGKGQRETVLYNKPIQYNSLENAWSAPLGEWGRYEVYIKLNTPGKGDGIYEFHYNGKLVTARANVRYRDNSEPVDRFMLSGYWNGREGGASHPAMTRWVRHIELFEGKEFLGALIPLPDPVPSPTPPNSLPVPPAISAVTLDWTHSGLDVTGKIADVTGFVVQLSSPAGNTRPTTVHSSERSFTWSEVVPGTYSAQVKAVNAAGASEWASTTVVVPEPPRAVPVPPRIV